jgi:hypothetical protein
LQTDLFPEYSFYLWSYIYKSWVSKYQKCAPLSLKEPDVESTSWASVPVKHKCVVWCHCELYFWSSFYWRESKWWKVHHVFVKHPTPFLRRHTIKKWNADMVPTWWLSFT